jgi:hypothetical protein
MDGAGVDAEVHTDLHKREPGRIEPARFCDFVRPEYPPPSPNPGSLDVPHHRDPADVIALG